MQCNFDLGVVEALLQFSLIYPNLTYCNIVRASTYRSYLERLNILQKRVIRNYL